MYWYIPQFNITSTSTASSNLLINFPNLPTNLEPINYSGSNNVNNIYVFTGGNYYNTSISFVKNNNVFGLEYLYITLANPVGAIATYPTSTALISQGFYFSYLVSDN
jgi:hypothetical protein